MEFGNGQSGTNELAGETHCKGGVRVVCFCTKACTRTVAVGSIDTIIPEAEGGCCVPTALLANILEYYYTMLTRLGSAT